jgi:hypothetical protein
MLINLGSNAISRPKTIAGWNLELYPAQMDKLYLYSSGDTLIISQSLLKALGSESKN